MKISELSIEHLGKIVCGDNPYFPYLKGHELVKFFNKFGFIDTYEQGFPTRWRYAEDKVRELNGTNKLRKLIEEIVDPRRFLDWGFNVDKAVGEINRFLTFDNFQLIKYGEFYKISDPKGILIQPETTKNIDHKFINEQIEKSQKKIFEGDFNGAITNARSLIEALFIEIIEREEKAEIKNDGNIENLWSRVKKIMKLQIDKTVMPDFIIQILSGLDTSIKGLAGLSNNAGDRHANKFETKKHHAKLAANLAMTLSDFLLDSWNYQNSKNGIR